MAEAVPYQNYATGPVARACQEQRELSFLLREAVRLVEDAELSAASETLREATVRATALQEGRTWVPETKA